ncbi:hypothetical protein N8D56_25095 (plasmid) [Devosia sp. A8/3-2]|nr:hypothetical protein N8D56_25095 [Devosia sp. A8/3-2]
MTETMSSTALRSEPHLQVHSRFWPAAEKFIGYGLLIFAALATITPFLWMVSTSFKTDVETFQFPPISYQVAWSGRTISTPSPAPIRPAS